MSVPEQHGLTIKIAVGVFLGLMAAWLLYSIPGWLNKRQEEQHALNVYERMRQVQAIPPDELVRRCGKLVEDYTGEDKMERDLIIEMTGPYSGNKMDKNICQMLQIFHTRK